MSLPDKKVSDNENNSRFLMKYAALGTQLLISLGLAVFAGLKADKWFKFSFPLLGWLLPLVVLLVILYKIVKDTAPKK
ncbi:MAG: AtpZ/AtpI family protein [Sphingobacteriales bacterium]|nr:AtpZ/AtpI family protein [Sphingobacteriales bacterium]